MSKKMFLFIMVIFLVAGTIFAAIRIAGKKPVRRPHVVVVAFDALRADHLSCYGYPKKTTPHIDVFAQEAVLFENAVCPATTTAPSFMSLFTALMPAVHNISNFEGVVYPRLSPHVATFPQILKQQGYFTAGFVDSINLSQEIGFGRGFDIYRQRCNYGRLQERIEELSAVVKKAKENSQPLFLFIHTFVTHAPYVYIPYEFNKRFLEEPVKGLPVYYSDVLPPDNFKDQASFFNRFDLSNPQHRRHMIGLYDSAVHYNDHIFRVLRDFLIREKLYDDSFVVVMADHGEEFYEHKGRSHGRLFVEAVHVPFIIKFPKSVYAARRIPQHVRTMDLFPTLFSWCGIKVPPFTQGVSFLALVTGKGRYRPLISSEGINGSSIRIVKDGYVYGGVPGTEREILYDYKADPGEQHNLVLEKPELVRSLRAVAAGALEEEKALVKKLNSQAEAVVYGDGQVIDELKALGYAQ